jgi:hypothetical protein
MKWWQIRKRNEDVERELRSDLELEEEEQRDRGLSADEARYAARRAFGNTTLIREHTHESWGSAPFERFLQDLRYALRQHSGSSPPPLLCLPRGWFRSNGFAPRIGGPLWGDRVLGEPTNA